MVGNDSAAGLWYLWLECRSPAGGLWLSLVWGSPRVGWWEFHQWKSLQRTGAVAVLPSCSGWVFGCSSSTGDEGLKSPDVSTSLSWWCSLGCSGGEHRGVLQHIHPWGLNFLSVTWKSVKWGIFSPKKVLLFRASKLQWTWSPWGIPGTRQVCKDEDREVLQRV